MTQHRLLVLYGTQTGTTEGFARIVFTFAKAHGFDVKLLRMDDYDFQHLPQEENVVLMTSTFYNGEFPDNATSFWKKLSAKEHPATFLQKVKFAVFGLGNKKNAENFNRAAKLLDERMASLGAHRLLPIACGDEYDANGHESAFRPWIKSLWKAMGGPNAGSDAAALRQDFVVETVTSDASSSGHVFAGFRPVKVTKNKIETAAGYDRVIHTVAFHLDKDQHYNLTDHIMVQPINPDDLVHRALTRLGLDGKTKVKITPPPSTTTIVPGPDHVLSIFDLFKYYLDISSIPSRSLLEGMACAASDTKQQEELSNLASDLLEGNAYAKATTMEIFSVVDALERFPSVSLSLSQIVTNFPTISHRFFSISSSPLVHPHELEICFVEDSWKANTSGKTFHGLASTYLASLEAGKSTANIKIVPGVLSLPKDLSTPIVGVALGTGIGVFHGILQHREELKKKGDHNISKMLLFYGIRHHQKDFAYQSQFESWQKQGLVDLVLSCSHDQKEFITPATKIVERAAEVTGTLSRGGVYVYCGLGGSIPGVMDSALQDAYCSTQNLSVIEADEVIKKLKEEKRHQVEAYAKSIDEENHLKNLILRKGGKTTDTAVPIAEQFKDAKMFCFQCEQTFQGKGCTTVGVCGKTPEVAALQDLLIHHLKILSWYAHHLRQLAKAEVALSEEDKKSLEDQEVNQFTLYSMFSTLTNVNFDSKRMMEELRECKNKINQLSSRYHSLCQKYKVQDKPCPVALEADEKNVTDMEDLFVQKGKKVGVLSRFAATKNDAVVGLQEMLVYGLKGVCAYADHAKMQNYEDGKIYEFVHEAMTFLLTKSSTDLGQLLDMLMKCGQINLITMELLHKANTTYGAQSPHTVPVKPVPGKCILISGHELSFLENILEQTKGKGINVYTHGEMLPGHGYPKLREHKHLVGHFGLAWQRQSLEFAHFPGAVVMTTNCLTPPREAYNDRLFTAGAVGWPNIPHIADRDFSAVIECALKLPGFTEADKEFTYTTPASMPKVPSFSVGFGHEVVISVADKVLDAVKKGDISHFFVIGGCDGYEGERNYFSELGKILPPTSVVLTAGCGKYRINHIDMKTIGSTGIPRLLDLGQCNDSYSAIQIAVALAGALGCGVNDLPLSIVLSWFEQKAIAVLLTLLFLGLKSIRVGPNLPAFLRPSVVQVLSDKFGLKLVDDPTKDLALMLTGH